MTLLPPYLAQTGYDQQGLPVLREAIARRYSERGLPTRPDEVMVVQRRPQRLRADPAPVHRAGGDRVVIDAPTYPMAISAIQGASCRPVEGLRFRSRDGTAMDWRRLLRRLRRGGAWLMPDFSQPGRCMDAPTRQRVCGHLPPGREQRW